MATMHQQSSDVPEFGQLLRHHRVAAGLTQEGLAERAGLSVHGVQKLERGATRPYRDTAQRLIAALRLGGAEEARLRTAARPSPRRRTSDRGAEPALSAVTHNLPIPVTTFIER